jgi:hypothetical protein
MEVLRQKGENLDFKAMGSSTACWARMHVPTTTLIPHRCAVKEPFMRMGSNESNSQQPAFSSSRVHSSPPLLCSSALATSSHQHTTMHARKSFKPLWALAQDLWAWTLSTELAKIQTCTRTPIRPFLFSFSFWHESDHFLWQKHFFL